MDSAVPATATFGEFARLAGFKRSYITQLRQDDRLVLDGRRVDVAASLERIKATADPSKVGVAARHATTRKAKGQANNSTQVDNDVNTPDDAPATPADMSYQTARAIKERYAAMAAKRDYELSMQQLLNAEDVRQTVLAAVTTLRSRMETLPDTLGPQVAATPDEGKARAILTEAMEHALNEIAREFHQLVVNETTQ